MDLVSCIPISLTRISNVSTNNCKNSWEIEYQENELQL